jgi:hypothetical protein
LVRVQLFQREGETAVKKAIVRIGIWGAVGLAVVIVLCLRNSQSQVPRLIGEAQALVDEGDKLEKDAETKSMQLLTGYLPESYYVATSKAKPAASNENAEDATKSATIDWDKLNKAVAGADAVLAPMAEKYHAAAGKFDEAKRASKGEIVAKYFDLRSRAYQARADCQEAKRKALAILKDKSISSEEKRRSAMNKLSIEAYGRDHEFGKLEEEAHDLHQKNDAEFRSAGLVTATQ